jgi:4-hydroxy-2-oxoheptanedioate aldolase
MPAGREGRMSADRLARILEQGGAAVGLWLSTAEMVEVSAHVGFDWFMVDQMFSANDWQRTEELLRAGEAAGITPVVRLQSYPWLGYDHRVAVDVARAGGVGARYVMVSASGPREIDECLQSARDWHRRLLTVYGRPGDGAPVDRMSGQPRTATQVIPHLETRAAIDATQGIMEHPEVQLLFIAVTDTLRVLTGDAEPDFNARELWDYVDAAVDLGRRHGVVIGANTGFAGSMDEIRLRVERLHGHGVRLIMIQGGTFLFQLAAQELLSKLAALR